MSDILSFRLNLRILNLFQKVHHHSKELLFITSLLLHRETETAYLN